jgi:hypothetical protein
MNGVCAQGDPCTATMFRFIAHDHLLYSANSTKSLTKYSILHKGISSQLHRSIKSVYLSDEICNLFI